MTFRLDSPGDLTSAFTWRWYDWDHRAMIRHCQPNPIQERLGCVLGEGRADC